MLLVDDEPKVLTALQRLPRHESYEILTAGNAEEAPEILTRTPVAAILSNEEMPGMRGSKSLARVARD